MSNAAPEILLEANAMTMQFGGIRAVDALSFKIFRGELMGLIGPNGAGKTTVFNMITGVYQPTEGQVFFEGKDVRGLKPYEMSHLGVTRTFQNIRLFKDLTILENIMIAGAQHIQYGLVSAVIQNGQYYREESELKKSALELLSIFKLDGKAFEVASSLSYGDQRKLEIVRALATRPKLICLDEPAAGLNHQETEQLMETIAKMRRDFKLTILLIEHDMKLVMGICERIVVLDHGVKIEEGTPQVIQNSAKVIEAYLGVDEDAAKEAGH